jgi:arylesterase / paraoxonase
VFEPLPNNDLRKVDHIQTDYCIDNFSVDKDGDIFGAALHAGQRFIEAFDDPLNALTPTGALRLRKVATGYEVTKVIEDGNIEVLPASTVVVHDAKTGRLFFGGMSMEVPGVIIKLILAGVFSPFIAVCDKV